MRGGDAAIPPAPPLSEAAFTGLKLQNYYDTLDWNAMLAEYPAGRVFDRRRYYEILSPDFPEFLNAYTRLPCMRRLAGIGLLCGTDWTPLYRNRFFYSRLDHSIGVALIVWHFTRDRAQTLAGLFHDIATPLFSHVFDFRNGDALSQTSTESETARLIQDDAELCALLAEDGIRAGQVSDYHRYPIADNDLPRLSADRLEYMFPSGAALQGSWTSDEIARAYRDLAVLENESGLPEIGFRTAEIAEEYCRKFCETGHVLQLNENKLALQLLAEITTLAVRLRIITEADCRSIREEDAVGRFERACAEFRSGENAENGTLRDFARLFRTFRTMRRIEHTQTPLDGHFCVSLKVKQRYIDPLVLTRGVGGGGKSRRLTALSESAAARIRDFLSYQDTPYGCVRLADV